MRSGNHWSYRGFGPWRPSGTRIVLDYHGCSATRPVGWYTSQPGSTPPPPAPSPAIIAAGPAAAVILIIHFQADVNSWIQLTSSGYSCRSPARGPDDPALEPAAARRIGHHHPTPGCGAVS